MKRDRKTQSRRYYLQNCLKPPISVDGIRKIITAPYQDFKSIPLGQRYYIGQLIKMGYNLQLSLFNANAMPIDYKEYPPDWEARRERILKRAGNRCEFCGIENYRLKPSGTKVILTIAHLDHDKKNWEVTDDRLAALCQSCHLNYDRGRHIDNRKYGRNFRDNQLNLFNY